MISSLKNRYVNLLINYTNDEKLIYSCWEDVQTMYSKKNRHYHNFMHVKSMLDLANIYKDQIIDFDILLFAIWYHDIIYKPLKNNNELKSAIFVEKVLKLFKIDLKRTENCKKMIISTKNHEPIILNNNDNKFLVDFDLSILSADWDVYSEYQKNIRKEYWIYPDFMYFKSRKKVLLQFLKRRSIYYTESFIEKNEKKARLNIKKELAIYD